MAGTHSHSHSRSGSRRKLKLVLVLSSVYMAAEFAGGILTGSLALLADAGHMLSDVAALGLSLFAMWIADKPGGPKQTYGYYRAEILAALLNAATLLAIAGFIFVEAYERLAAPRPVPGGWMIAIASGGLVINLIGLWILQDSRSESLNMRGAFLHIAADALGSVGAIGAGLLIWGYGWYWVDPAASVVIASLVLYSAWNLLVEAVAVLMESAPRGIDVDEVGSTIRALDGVQAVHDLHVWTITTNMVAMSAHVETEEGADHAAVLRRVKDTLHRDFGIDHTTIQIDPEGYADEYCGGAARCPSVHGR